MLTEALVFCAQPGSTTYSRVSTNLSTGAHFTEHREFEDLIGVEEDAKGGSFLHVGFEPGHLWSGLVNCKKSEFRGAVVDAEICRGPSGERR